jgi:integrase
MKTFKPTYRDKKTGKKKKCSHYYLTFTDNRQIRRRLPAYSDKRASERLAQRIEELLSCGGILSPDLQKWIETLPGKQRRKLIEWELIDNYRFSENIGKLLSEHLKDFRAYLLARENSKAYVKQITERIEYVFSECGFKVWTDIDANKIYTFLGDMRKNGIGQRTFNFYLKGAKSFCRWMIRDRRVTPPSPLEHLSTIKQTEIRRKRRALAVDEQSKLLEVAAAGKPHHNLTGPERALVYKLAIQTGLRSNELKSLTKSSFDFIEGTVTVQAGYTKNKETAVIDLKRQTAEELKIYLANKLPHMNAFAMPDQPVKMLKKDLKAAKIPYKTDEGYADWHSLRHCFITNLARQGVHPKDAQVLARHSSITLTMDYYTHTKRESLRKIIENQPDLGNSDVNGLSVA